MKSLVLALLLAQVHSVKVRDDQHPASLVEDKDVDAMLLSLDLQKL
jgi:hypothetical protein